LESKTNLTIDQLWWCNCTACTGGSR